MEKFSVEDLRIFFKNNFSQNNSFYFQHKKIRRRIFLKKKFRGFQKEKEEGSL